MSLVRFGVSLEKDLLKQFDALTAVKSYVNRSEAIRDLIRDALVARQWQGRQGTVAGVISIVYDHHRRELVDSLLDIQHMHQDMVVASQHIHLDHNNCLEVIIVRGDAKDAEQLAATLRSSKGVKHGSLTMATTGKELK